MPKSDKKKSSKSVAAPPTLKSELSFVARRLDDALRTANKAHLAMGEDAREAD